MKTVIKVAFVIGVTALAWFNVAAAIIAIAAAILAALQSKAGMIIELSFGPLRAKLEREVSVAEKLVDQLREFAALQAKAIVGAGVRTGRFADNSDWLFKQVRATEDALRSMGVSEKHLSDARSEFVTYTLADAADAALGGSIVPSKDGVSLKSEWREASGELGDTNPDRIEAFLKKYDFMNPERAKLLDDMRWMIAHNDVRDADQYLRARRVIEL
jgi:hypothetical protein